MKRADDIFQRRAAEAELVNLVADHNSFTPEDRAEALERALADPERALSCFRALAAEIPDPQTEARRRRVLELLAANPSARYALVTDLESDPESAIIALAIRGRASFELRVPKAKYDGTLLLDLIERHGATVH